MQITASSLLETERTVSSGGAARFCSVSTDISVIELNRAAQGWILDCEIRQHSPRTLEARRALIDKLVWFLNRKGHTSCGTLGLRQFLAHISRGHEEKDGRWGQANDPLQPRSTRPVRPRTVQTYHGHLRTFFRWLIAEGMIEASPMEAISAPVARPDQIQPFTDAQVEAMLAAARKSLHRRRDEAIILFLLDTGVRAGELCGLAMKDIDLTTKRAYVLGKGNKHRTVYFGRATAKALCSSSAMLLAILSPMSFSAPFALTPRG